MSIEIIFKEEDDLNDHSADTVYDLADCCRTCLQHECSLTPTNSTDSDSIKFCDKLTACVSGMRWAMECVPSFICGICIEKLRIAYDFQALCLQSDQALKLQEEANQIDNSRSSTPDPMGATDLARCDETIRTTVSSVKCEETQVQLLPQCAPVTSAGAQLEVDQVLDDPPNDGRQVWGKELRKHIGKHTGKKHFQCSQLTASMQIPTEKKRYACNFCERSYVHASKLRMHIFSHSREQQFACRYCKKKFTRSLLFVHLKTHTSDKCWRCRVCSKSFTTSSNLSLHMKKHTGEGFFCKSCGQKFKHYSQLLVHRREHTGKQLYKCTICDKVCRYPVELKMHVTTHIGEKLTCSICDKKFANRRMLNSHRKTHTGRKPWQCKICNKSYTKSCHLKEHMIKHSGEKFSCKLCDKEFTYPSSLNRHIKTHTSD